jgi:raffinose/stachyose/melibiose transport system substrate-binding protein
MNRRPRPFAVVAAILTLVLAACTGVRTTQPPGGGASGGPTQGAGGSGDPATSAPASGDIRYLVEAPEDPSDLDPLREHLKDFEAANPGITVELEAIPLTQLRQTLQATLRGQNPPDVFAWGSGPAYAGALAEAGLLYDLTAAYDQYDWPIYEGAKQQVTFDDKIVGIPGEMETVGIYYNKKIFADLAISEPQNLADLEAAAQKVKDAGIIPFAAADQEGWEASHWFSMALGSRLGSAGVTALLEGETSWNSPDVIAALAIWDRWNKAGFLPPTPTGISYDNGNALFYSSEAAMVPTGSWLANDIADAEEVDFEVGYIPFPSETGPGLWSVGLGSGPYIAANSQNPEAALAFVDWLVSPEHGRWVVENLLTIPPYPVDTTGLELNPLFAEVLEDIGQLSGGSSDFGANIDVQSTDDFNEAMFDGLQSLLTGDTTPEQLAQELQAAYEQGQS